MYLIAAKFCKSSIKAPSLGPAWHDFSIWYNYPHQKGLQGKIGSHICDPAFQLSPMIPKWLNQPLLNESRCIEWKQMLHAQNNWNGSFQIWKCLHTSTCYLFWNASCISKIAVSNNWTYSRRLVAPSGNIHSPHYTRHKVMYLYFIYVKRKQIIILRQLCHTHNMEVVYHKRK